MFTFNRKKSITVTVAKTVPLQPTLCQSKHMQNMTTYQPWKLNRIIILSQTSKNGHGLHTKRAGLKDKVGCRNKENMVTIQVNLCCHF